MPTSPLIEAARALLAPGSRPWENAGRNLVIAARLRAEGEHDLAGELEAACATPLGWPGGTTIG